jgi:hypothetical protein
MQISASNGFKGLRSSKYPSTSPDQYERAFNFVGDVNVVFPVRFWHLDSVSPPAVQELGDVRIRIPTADVVSTEDTGWRVGGELAHMMIFVTVTATVFQVRDHHRYEEVREVIGDD